MTSAMEWVQPPNSSPQITPFLKEKKWAFLNRLAVGPQFPLNGTVFDKRKENESLAKPPAIFKRFALTAKFEGCSSMQMSNSSPGFQKGLFSQPCLETLGYRMQVLFCQVMALFQRSLSGRNVPGFCPSLLSFIFIWWGGITSPGVRGRGKPAAPFGTGRLEDRNSQLTSSGGRARDTQFQGCGFESQVGQKDSCIVKGWTR